MKESESAWRVSTRDSTWAYASHKIHFNENVEMPIEIDEDDRCGCVCVARI